MLLSVFNFFFFLSFPSTFSLLHIKKYLTVKSFTRSQIRRKSAVTLDSDNLLFGGRNLWLHRGQLPAGQGTVNWTKGQVGKDLIEIGVLLPCAFHYAAPTPIPGGRRSGRATHWQDFKASLQYAQKRLNLPCISHPEARGQYLLMCQWEDATKKKGGLAFALSACAEGPMA